MLCLNWCDKRSVTMLSSIHNAVETQVKTNYFGKPIIKPFIVHDYNIKMGRADHSDNYLSHYITCSVKWSKKVILNFISMIFLNAYPQ